MTSKLYLGIVLHNHQPVGNYGFVIEQVYNDAYLPMLEALERHPGVRVAPDLEQLLLDPRIQAVAIATPPRTHHELARQALRAGKHVLVEKPLASSVDQADELIELAERQRLVLMPGHTFVYSPAVNKVRELIRSGEVGEVYFITSSRMNLGLYQPDGVISDLAPHDLSILLYWLERPLARVSAAAQSIFQLGVPETAFLTVSFAGGATANVQVSWLAPRKLRQMVVVGSRRMISYEDTSSDEAVRIYDRGLDFCQAQAPATFGEYQLTYRSGDIVVPRIEAVEPLSLELEDFARAIRYHAEPRSNSALGREIVRSKPHTPRWSGRASQSSSRSARIRISPESALWWTEARPLP